jgi:hypothetical protein
MSGVSQALAFAGLAVQDFGRRPFELERRGRFQYGDLHAGHATGTPAALGIQVWPHRSHCQPGRLTIVFIGVTTDRNQTDVRLTITRRNHTSKPYRSKRSTATRI